MTQMNKLMTLSIGILLGVLISMTYNWVRCDQETPVCPTKTTSVSSMTSDTTLEVSSKNDVTSPDLVVNHSYVAVVNGERLEVPLKTTDKTSTKVTTVVDMTPIVSKMSPKWEAGIGVSYHKKEILPTLSVQRNYQQGKAVEMSLFIKDNQIKGGSLVHKWTF